MAELDSLLATQEGAITSAQAASLGLTSRQVLRLTRRGEWLRLRRGVYTTREEHESRSPLDRDRTLMVAAGLSYRAATVSEFSAGWLYRLPCVEGWPVRPTLTIDPSKGWHPVKRSGATIQVASLPEWQTVSRGGWSIASVARTVCDMARQTRLPYALVPIDAALHSSSTDKGELTDVLAVCDGWQGSSRAEHAVRRAHAASESPYETIARWALQQAGYDARPQVWAYDEQGPIGRGDIWLPQLWTFLEVDGAVKYGDDADSSTLLSEKWRQERFERGGFGVVRAGPIEIDGSFNSVLARIRRVAAVNRLAREHLKTRPRGYVGPPTAWSR